MNIYIKITNAFPQTAIMPSKKNAEKKAAKSGDVVTSVTAAPLSAKTVTAKTTTTTAATTATATVSATETFKTESESVEAIGFHCGSGLVFVVDERKLAWPRGQHANAIYESFRRTEFHYTIAFQRGVPDFRHSGETLDAHTRCVQHSRLHVHVQSVSDCFEPVDCSDVRAYCV